MDAIQELVDVVARLRGPGGCPWDQEQTHQSLTDCLVEEVSELLETIDSLNYVHMREELGDVLLQVVFHAVLAQEEDRFTLDEVAREVTAKLVRRHPHVFGDGRLETSDQVLHQWDQIKAAEKKGEAEAPLFKDLPPRLPALRYAYDIYKQILKRDLDTEGHLDRNLIADTSKGMTEESAGERLFELAAACRHAGIDPEAALRRFASGLQEDLSSPAPSPLPPS